MDPDALDQVQALLGERERRADLLIEHLHLLQDHFGCLYARHLVALAEEMKLALAEVYEVASFYAHFDIVLDEDSAPPAITVRVCDSLSCALAGGETLLEELRSRLGDGVRVVRAPCMGGCDKAPAVAIAHALHENATADSVAAAVAAGETHPHLQAYPALDGYRASGGYKLLQACFGGEKPVEDIIKSRIAVPGTMTTAYLALKLFAPEIATDVVPFDQIIPQVLAGKYEAGLIIHEGQLTFNKSGLHKIVDMGKWWRDKTGLPLPLGGNAIRRELGP